MSVNAERLRGVERGAVSCEEDAGVAIRGQWVAGEDMGDELVRLWEGEKVRR